MEKNDFVQIVFFDVLLLQKCADISHFFFHELLLYDDSAACHRLPSCNELQVWTYGAKYKVMVDNRSIHYVCVVDNT